MRNKFPWVATTTHKGLLSEARKLTSYSSHSGLTSKMWILPDDKAVSIGVQHYEWALRNSNRLRDAYGIDLSRLRPQEDTAIRLYLLSKGCVRVNYEHRSGMLTLEAHHLHWRRKQRAAYRAIVSENLKDIFFVRVRLLNKFAKIIRQGFVELFTYADEAKLRHLPLVNATHKRSRRGR